MVYKYMKQEYHMPNYDFKFVLNITLKKTNGENKVTHILSIYT